jgi:hypothetical protein
MRKTISISFFLFLVAALSVACSKSKTATQLAEEICECSKKSNSTTDPNRAQAQKDCTKMQGEYWNKVKDDNKKADEFNAVLSKCASEQIKDAFK